MNNFVAFILTNGRPDRVYTYDTLRGCGYNGKIILLVDNLDKTKEDYIRKYGDQVIVFDKEEIAKTFDQGDNFNDMRAIIYARNASFEIAKKLKIEAFIQLDDDYEQFKFRFNSKFQYKPKTMNKTSHTLDCVFDSMVQFLKNSNISSIAMSQGGDFIGGASSSFASEIKTKRKCMNSFVCLTDRPFKFIGRVNEDVNTYTRLASTGKLFFTINQISLDQKQTQSNLGGMTEMYLSTGTYVKSFYSVMYQPSSVKVKVLKDRLGGRLHHSVSWNNTAPMILRETIKKEVRNGTA